MTDPCPTCGRERGFLMSTHDVDVWVKITGSPALILAFCAVVVLAFVCGEAVLR